MIQLGEEIKTHGLLRIHESWTSNPLDDNGSMTRAWQRHTGRRRQGRIGSYCGLCRRGRPPCLLPRRQAVRDVEQDLTAACGCDVVARQDVAVVGSGFRGGRGTVESAPSSMDLAVAAESRALAPSSTPHNPGLDLPAPLAPQAEKVLTQEGRRDRRGFLHPNPPGRWAARGWTITGWPVSVHRGVGAPDCPSSMSDGSAAGSGVPCVAVPLLRRQGRQRAAGMDAAGLEGAGADSGPGSRCGRRGVGGR